MGSLDELRKSTLVDSRSNRYGKSFHLDSKALHFIESRGEKPGVALLSIPSALTPWHPYRLPVFNWILVCASISPGLVVCILQIELHVTL